LWGVVPHYESSLQQDVDRIHSRLTDMSRRATRGLQDSLEAFVQGNRQLAYSVILRDTFIDDLDREIDRLTLEFILRQQPVGLHLRFAASVLKVNLELERVGDYAKSLAKQVLNLSRYEFAPPLNPFLEIADKAIPMLDAAVQAFVQRDVEAARRVIATEPEVEALRNAIGELLFQERQAGRIPLEAYTPLTNLARRLERVADQAKNISQETLFMVTGEYAKHKDTETIRILFVGATASGPALTAEAIGQAVGDSRFIFSSAGIEAGPIHPSLVEFLQGKGHEVGALKARTPDQIPNLEFYQVIVALSPRAREVFPPAKARTVNLEWSVEDPSNLEKTYVYLREQVGDLVAALLGERQSHRH
jgi:phosphate transport system protein